VAEAKARASVVQSFDVRRDAYQQGWHEYLDA